jgi:putative component of toxin-antitoxin plasmid stabilization module
MDIREYLTRDGHSPHGTWLRNLRDVRARARIRVRQDIERAKGFWSDYRKRDDG